MGRVPVGQGARGAGCHAGRKPLLPPCPPQSSTGGTGLAFGCCARALDESGRGSPSGTSRFLRAEVRQGGGCGDRRLWGG